MKQVSTAKHPNVRVGIYPDNIKAGKVVLTCIDCSHTVVGGYGKPGADRSQEDLELELDGLECQPTYAVTISL